MATTELAKESANHCLNLMMCGIGQSDGKPLYPVDAHFQEQLFDLAKLEAYSAKGALKSSPGATVKTITEESITKFAKSYATSVSASGSYGFPCGAAVSGSVTADFNSESSEEHNTKFVQIRKKAQYASMKLPKKLMRAKLRALLDGGAKEAIDAVASPADADEAIEAFGPVYMHAATFGAILVCSTKSTSSEFTSAKKLETAMKAEIEYLTCKASASAKFNMGSNTGKKSSSVTFEVSAVGGRPALILNGEESEWIKSAGQNLNIIDLELAPISNLALKGSKAESLLLERIEHISLGMLAKFSNTTANTRRNFSCLDRLEGFRRSKTGKLELRLSWPGAGLAPQHWRQRSNPFLNRAPRVEDYEAISCPHSNNGWGGLRAGHGDALLNGSATGPHKKIHFFYAVGVYKLWSGAIPGPSTAVRCVELHARGADGKWELVVRQTVPKSGVEMWPRDCWVR